MYADFHITFQFTSKYQLHCTVPQMIPDLHFCVQIFERLGVQICVQLAWFHVDGTPKGTYEFSTGRLACDQAVRPQSAPKSLLIG